jgi:transcription termination/antitermination protein NusA
MLDIKQIEIAINVMSAEKKIPKEKLVKIIEAAIKTAYKKDFWKRDEKVNVKIDFETEALEISIEKTVVKDVTNPALEISLKELWEDAENFSQWDVIELDVTDEVNLKDKWWSFWRIAASAARQVLIQKIWDSEKEKVYDLFEWKQWQIINLKVDLVEWWKVIFDYKWNQVVLPKSEQVSRDVYAAGLRFFVYIAEVSKNETGVPKVILSRKRPELVSAIFAEFVPEIWDEIINIDRVVRQSWVKTKILVSSNFEEIDPVWTLIWQKWIRVKWVMEELSWEKIDIIANSWDLNEIIKKSLSPAEIAKVEIDEENAFAKVFIPPSERARAVWRNWLNVNLASELTWYKISIENFETPASKKEEEGEKDKNEITWVIDK